MADSTETKVLSLDDDDRPTKEGRIAVELSVNHAEKTSYFRNICAEIADFVFLQLVLLARSSVLRFPALLPILAGLTFSFLLHL